MRLLKKLSWTNYHYEGGVNFVRLASAGADMEFLEVGLSSGAVYGGRWGRW